MPGVPGVTSAPLRGSLRGREARPFAVMEVVHRVASYQKQGRHVLPLHVGQPDAQAPGMAARAAEMALEDACCGRGGLGYTVECGLPSLRERIARYYQEEWHEKVDPDHVVVTTGSSGAFLLSFLAAFDAGDHVAIGVPGYPCYQNVLEALEVHAVDLRLEAKSNYQPNVSMLEQKYQQTPFRGLVLTSPSNPCGTVIRKRELQKVQQWCKEHGVWLISDEIYHSIIYGDAECATACNMGDNVIVINSFSKYYCMTGWRLGWMVLPPSLVEPVKRLAQSLYISAPTLSQHAALAAFDCKEELDGHVQRYALNRDILLEELPKAGFKNLSSAEGAFYIYADVSGLSADSVDLANRILEHTEVAVTPGVDFDPVDGRKFIRISFASSTDTVREACRRLVTNHRWRQGY
eukprot:scaffold467_cov366-Pavlova_lutheri.AAC.13